MAFSCVGQDVILLESAYKAVYDQARLPQDLSQYRVADTDHKTTASAALEK